MNSSILSNATALCRLHAQLLKWFDAEQRTLPWRENRDPYRIWVSEVMLQQTTVAAVQNHYLRFLQAFPTLEALAGAEEQQVLHAWQGLGYYRRARHLHQAAKQLVVQHGGLIPNDPEICAELPGVGPYILGAVLSQAFDRRLPIVEANSMRVLCRWLGYRDDPREGAGKKWVWQAAESLLPGERCGDYNQAIMELGAVICTPTAPACDRCPVQEFCQAYQTGDPEAIPPKKTVVAPTEVREVAVVIRRGDRFLFCQRPVSSRWANLWEFPHGALQPGEAPEAGAERIAKELTGLEVNVRSEVMTLRHTVTRYRIQLIALDAETGDSSARSDFYIELKWLTQNELASHPTSTPQRRLVEAIHKSSRSLRLFD